MMTRKDFIKIADACTRMELTPMQLDTMVDTLKTMNPRFDEGRFRIAALLHQVSSSATLPIKAAHEELILMYLKPYEGLK